MVSVFDQYWLFMERFTTAYATQYLTVRLTPESGRSSDAADTNSFPYFAVNKFLICNKSGTSEHLWEAKIMLDIASRNSGGHSL